MAESYLARHVAEMREDIALLEKKIRVLEDFKLKMMVYGTLAMAVIGFLTGGGDISLKHFLGH